MHSGIGNYDWVSFLIECDELEFQTFWLPEWNALIVNRIPEPVRAKKSRVHALGATKGGRRRYTLAVWGEYAPLVTGLPFTKWADHLSRVDIRTRLYDCREDTFERLCLALENADTRNNIETFKVAGRTKNHMRDSGGRGVRYGSRKSDISSKIYRRGKELPAIETQFQDDKLSNLVLQSLELLLESPLSSGPWRGLLLDLQAFQYRHINNWLFQSGINRELDGLRHDDIPMPPALKDMYQRDMFYGGEPPASDDEDALSAPVDLTEPDE